MSKDFTVRRKSKVMDGKTYHLFGFCKTKAEADRLLKKFYAEGSRARKVKGSGGYWIYRAK